MASLGDLVVNLFAETAKFQSDLGKAVHTADRATRQMRRLFLGVAGALGAVSFGAMIKGSLDAADAAAKTAQSVGTTVEELSGLQHAASLSGVSNEQLATALARVSRTASDAQQGLETAERGFRSLGISVERSGGVLKTSGEILLEVAERFEGLRDGAAKTAVAQELFGRSGAALIPLLNQGREGIGRLTEQAERLGLVFSTDTAKASERVNDNMTILRGGVRGLANALTQAMLPVLEAVTTQLIRTGDEAQQTGPRFEGFSKFLKITAFTAFTLKEELLDLGNLIGSIGAILDTKIGPGMLDQIRAIIDARKEARAATERRIQDFVASLEGIGKSFEPQKRALAEIIRGNDEAGKAAEKAAAKQENAVRRQIEALQTEARVFGLSRAAATTYRLALEGATKAQIDQAVAAIGSIEAFERHAKAVSDARAVWEATRTPAEQLGIEVERLGKLAIEGALDWETYHRAVEAAQKQFEESTEKVKETESAAKDLGLTFTSAFEAAVTGGSKLSDVLRGLARDVAGITLRKLVTEPLDNILTKAFEPVVPRAAGGPVSAGRAFLVGERGPELFMPATSGTIAPNGALSPNVTVQVVNTGTPQRVDRQEQRVDVAGAVVTLFTSDIRSGGPISRSLESTFGLGRG